MKSPKQYTMFSLRRQLLRFVMTLVILLLLIMTTFMAVIIHSYQRKVNDLHKENAASYAAHIDSSILQLRDTVGYIYSSDAVFQGLYLYQHLSLIHILTEQLSIYQKYLQISAAFPLHQLQEFYKNRPTHNLLRYGNYFQSCLSFAGLYLV